MKPSASSLLSAFPMVVLPTKKWLDNSVIVGGVLRVLRYSRTFSYAVTTSSSSLITTSRVLNV